VTSCYGWSQWKQIRKCLQELSWKNEAIEEQDWKNKERINSVLNLQVIFLCSALVSEGKTCKISLNMVKCLLHFYL